MQKDGFMKNLHSKPILAVVLGLITIQLIWGISLGIQPVKADSKTIIVPDDYPTISAAIGNATPGDTILVKPGTYYENPVVNISLTIESEVPNGAVVIGSAGVFDGGQGVFTLAGNDITLEGFQIQSLNYSSALDDATGIMLLGNNCTLSHNTMIGDWYGIFSSTSSGCTIIGNTVTYSGHIGIRISGGSQNEFLNNLVTENSQSGTAIDGYSDIISGNNFTDNGLHGLGIGASYSLVYDNNMTGNMGDGLYIGASFCTVTSNTLADNEFGVCLENSFAAPINNTFYDNNFINNSGQISTYSPDFIEFWDNGSVGNYWSDYTGVSASNSGIGSSPYTVCLNNIDYYPLVAPIAIGQGTRPALPFTPKPLTGTVASWSFDEMASDGVTLDSVGGNYMTLSGNQSMLVAGVQGNAAEFNGTAYGAVTPSPTLNITDEVTIDAWIYVPQYKDVEYNNIFVECVYTTATYPTRDWGLAINGVAPENSSQPIVGALRGFMLDTNGVFNEIDTTTPVALNQWVHVVFVRSLTNGMHIYVNGVEQNVTVLSGVQDPTAQVAPGTECYVGHDSFTTIDDLSISNVAVEPSSPALWAQWWFWTATVAVFAAFAAALLLFKRNLKSGD